MTHIGLIYCAYATKDYLAASLAPWVALRRAGKVKVSICAVNVLFAGFEGADDGTRELLRGYLDRGDIDHLVDGPDNIPETTARSIGLAWVRSQGCDFSVQWDSDEVATTEELARTVAFMEQDVFSAAWRFSYRNLVFTPDQWLAEPFTPMRAHRIKHGSYVADRFYDDNNVMYKGRITRDFRQDVSFATVTVPPSILSPAHHTWLNDTPENKARSRAKERYQRETRGWCCSFAWDDAQGGLIFNPALPRPKVIHEIP